MIYYILLIINTILVAAFYYYNEYYLLIRRRFDTITNLIETENYSQFYVNNKIYIVFVEKATNKFELINDILFMTHPHPNPNNYNTNINTFNGFGIGLSDNDSNHSHINIDKKYFKNLKIMEIFASTKYPKYFVCKMIDEKNYSVLCIGSKKYIKNYLYEDVYNLSKFPLVAHLFYKLRKYID